MLFDLLHVFRGDDALPAPTVTRISHNETLISYVDVDGAPLGEVAVEVEGDSTEYRFYDPAGALLGTVFERIQPGMEDIRIMDADGDLISRERTTARDEYTLVETWDETGFTGAVKSIHTETRTGEQVYDADWTLISAHLEIDDGNGRTQVAEYGEGWSVISRETVTVSGNVTTTVLEEDGAGNISGGTVETVKADFTLVETFGPGWTLTGAVKTIHTATTTGEHVYDADWALISAHLETDDGNGRTQVAEYGADWFVISRETVTVSGNVTTTVLEEDGAGNISGGTVETVKADFTLVETFGPGWTLTGAVKTIHSEFQTGEQVYDADWGLLSASLVLVEGNRHVTELYGEDWALISRLRVTTTDDKVVTEQHEGEDARLMWRSIVYAAGAEAENRFEVFDGSGAYAGTAARDLALGGDAADVLDGAEGDDTIEGGAGDDLLDGGDGDDLVFGGDGDDTVRGGAGADQLSGDDGDDRLIAGGLGDMLSGGEGADVFVFALAESDPGAVHTITDFSQGLDLIELGGATGATVTTEAQGGSSKISVDADLDGSSDLTIIVQGVDAVTTDDVRLA
ncbi:hypothetical protein KUV62_20235 [Salipiger bermudensis]|uniref:calcium-binding protein n=1 Tax=Salipiger bermudensis TaxID=344736 RepID=UPI001C9968BB|nr:calcium-binding protein [Salipiger bermudensis]MBY6006264.1 hypothetical protein [Salipiger bermudensis]